MRRDRLPYLVLPVAALIAVLPLMLGGPSCGHDYHFHTLNWIEVASQFAHGNLHPRWAVSPAYNAGEPRFLFYPPVSWTMGALLGLLMPWTWTPVAYTWVALSASGLAMHRLTRAHAGPAAAAIASTLYLANPYMLFTAYERTAYAELLAAAFLPLLLHAVLKPRPSVAGIAIPLALLWLTNAPAAVMGTYALALLAVIRLLQEKHDRGPVAATTAIGTALGLGMATFYILPAALERRYVQIAMVVIPGMRIDDNTLFHHTGLSVDALAHDVVLHTASVIAVMLLVATGIALALSRRSSLRAPLLALTAVIAFLLTPLSLPLWHHLPELGFLQFSWRLLAILGAVLGLAAATALDSLTLSKKMIAPVCLALAASLSLPAIRAFRQPCDDTDTMQARLADFKAQTGSEPTDEYTPRTAGNDSLKRNDPPYFLSQTPDAPIPPDARTGPAPRDLTLTVAAPISLILNLRQYPDWTILLNGQPAPAGSPRDDGLVNIPLPAGVDHVQIALRTTPLEYGADGVSLAAVLALWLVRRRRTEAPSSN